MEKRRDLFPRLVQGASFLFLATCLSVTYECVQIHDSKAGLPENPLADPTLQASVENPNTPEASSKDGLIETISNLFTSKGDAEKTQPLISSSESTKPSPNPTPTTVVEEKVATNQTKVQQPLDFNFLDSSKPAGLEPYAVTQRISGNKVNYSINLNPGWGEQTRTLVDKSFFHEKEINLFIFAEAPDPVSVVKMEKYQEKYAQQEVDKIAATHPALIPFRFEQEVRSFRRRNWGSFRFVQNDITKLILYTHAGKNGKYSMIISSQKDLLSSEMRKIWMSAAETFEVDLDAKNDDEPKTARESENPKPATPK